MSNKVNGYLSKKISHYMFVLTLMVVFIHVSGYMRDKLYVGELRYEWNVFIEIFGQGITRVAVPLFFVISGILAFSKENINESVLIKGGIKRLKTLGITYIIWNIIYAVYNIICYKFIDNIDILSQISFWDVIDIIFNHKYNFVFWYVQQLLIISFLSPIIYKLIKNKNVFIVFAVITFILNLVYKYIPYIDIVFPGAFFYFFGAGIALHFNNIIDKPAKKHTIVLSLIVLVLMQLFRIWIVNTYPDDTSRISVFHRLYETLTPVVFWYGFDFIKFEKRKIMFFEKHTFMVYASLIIPISYISSNMIVRLLHLYSQNIVVSIMIFMAISFFVYFIISGFSYVLNKIFPKIQSILTGGR